MVQGGSPCLHGTRGQKAEIATLTRIFSLLLGKSGKPGKQGVPLMRNTGMPVCHTYFDSFLAPRDYLQTVQIRIEQIRVAVQLP